MGFLPTPGQEGGSTVIPLLHLPMPPQTKLFFLRGYLKITDASDGTSILFKGKPKASRVSKPRLTPFIPTPFGNFDGEFCSHNPSLVISKFNMDLLLMWLCGRKAALSALAIQTQFETTLLVARPHALNLNHC